jgi:hypothetical protein
MEFNREGLEELFADGVLNPATMSEAFLQNCSKYKELGSRVFLLYEPDLAALPNGADFDIVLLHGLGSDEFNCWTNAQGIVWPAVFFPQDFPTARVLTVGYAHSLFNWKSDTSEAAEMSTRPLSITPSSASSVEKPSLVSVSPHDLAKGVAEEEGGALRDVRSLADRVEQTAKESVSAYAPKKVSQWWEETVGGRRRNEKKKPKTPSSDAVSGTPSSTREKESESMGEGEASTHTGNRLFQLLANIRDSTGSLVASEYESSAYSLSNSIREDGEAADSKHSKTSRDIRSLQNMRIVAAEVAERLCSAEVGVGQRPVVFMVHSMGGLILKQMLISLFEAARVAPPSAMALCLAALPRAEAKLTPPEAAVSQNCVAVEKANILLRAVRGVVFYGTPHFGSAVASVITGLQKYYQGLGGLTPTSVVTGLGDHNRLELMRLNDRFFDVVERLGDELETETTGSSASALRGGAMTTKYVAAMQASLASTPNARATSCGPMASVSECSGCSGRPHRTVWILSFGETKKLNGLVRVVDPESANPAPDDPRYPFYLVNADHGEVCRPLTKMSPSYAMVYGMLDRMQQRGLLKWQQRHTTSTLPLGDSSSLSSPPGSAEAPPGTLFIEKMSERYESGWSALFNPARVTSCISDDEGGDSTSPYATSSLTHASNSVKHQRNLFAFQQGLGEMHLAVPELEEALAELYHLQHRLFSVATPPQLDSIFLLAADVTDFVTRFYRREASVVQTSTATKWNAHEPEEVIKHPKEEALVDELVSFRVPLQVLIYWVRQAADLLRVFELSQQERAISIDTRSEASPTVANWETNLSMHPGSRDLRELNELEQNVGVVREEWEAFRRYASLRIRAASTTLSTSRAALKDTESAKEMQPRHELYNKAEELGDLPVREHIAVLFFARAMRTIVSQHLHDGGALGGLLGAYLRSAILQIRGSEKQLSSACFKRDPWSRLECPDSPEAESIVSLVMEGLELSLTPSSHAKEGSSVLTDTSCSGVVLTSNAKLRAVVPALTATSSVLLGCFALFVDKMHRLDGRARWPRAVQQFQLAIAALEADFQIRGQLLRTASRTAQKEGLVASPPPPVGRAGAKSTEREWWKAPWDLTMSKAGPTSAAGSSVAGVVAAAFADGRQAHVAKLDDGLFLSAVQLVAESFLCSVFIQASQSRHALVSGIPPWPFVKAEEGRGVCAQEETTRAQLKKEKGGQRAATQDDPLENLVRSMAAAQKVYARTSQILRGVFALSDTEKPFALPGRAAGISEAVKSEGANQKLEKSVKEQLREAIQSILSELDDDGAEVDKSGKSAGTQASKEGSSVSKADESRHQLSWTSHASTAKKSKKESKELVMKSASTTAAAAVTGVKKSRKNGLPMLIMNSLSKAWDAVRSGGAAAETPEHFAYTAMVMWWVVEWEAAAAITNAAATAFNHHTNEGIDAAPLRAKLSDLLNTVETSRQRRNRATATSPQTASGTSVNAVESSAITPGPHAKEEERWEAQCWSNANAATRCKWMTLRGGEDFLRGFHEELRAERDALEKILTSNSVDQLRDMQGTLAPPTALMQQDGEGGTQLGIPSPLLDAVQHDDTTAALRCWLGHCYAAHCMRSPDTAHAYLQVIRNDYAANKKYMPTAEVGLAWSHIHNVPCSFLQLWRTSHGVILPGQGVESGRVSAEPSKIRDGSDMRTRASLLGFRSTGVIDTSALHSVPLAFRHFCHDAVVHHTHAVQNYLQLQGTPQASTDPSPFLQSLSLVGHTAHPRSLRHLRLAEEGFRRALRANPVSIGALCGLGRLRCLSVRPSLSNYDDVHCVPTSCISASPFSSPYARDAGRSARRNAEETCSADAKIFFAAALDVDAHRRPSPTSAVSAWRASAESCSHAMDSVWLSYAAYWMSEETRGVRVTSGDGTGAAAASVSQSSSDPPESREWLLRSLRYYPRNDWTLTSLGLSDLQSSAALYSTMAEDATEGTGPSESRGRNGVAQSDIVKLRGLTLLHHALKINPTNMWALWGIGTYGESTAHRTTCQQLLRGLILKNIPRL